MCVLTDALCGRRRETVACFDRPSRAPQCHYGLLRSLKQFHPRYKAILWLVRRQSMPMVDSPEALHRVRPQPDVVGRSRIGADPMLPRARLRAMMKHPSSGRAGGSDVQTVVLSKRSLQAHELRAGTRSARLVTRPVAAASAAGGGRRSGAVLRSDGGTRRPRSRSQHPDRSGVPLPRRCGAHRQDLGSRPGPDRGACEGGWRRQPPGASPSSACSTCRTTPACSGPRAPTTSGGSCTSELTPSGRPRRDAPPGRNPPVHLVLRWRLHVRPRHALGTRLQDGHRRALAAGC
jgi:hypothetical protein